MFRSKNRSKKFVQIAIFVLALTATPKLLVQSNLLNPVFAQSQSPSPIPLPESIPSGTTVKLDGSSSMQIINEALKKRFEQKYPGTKVDLASGGTDGALAALQRGDINLAAIGRPLTNQEKAQGLLFVPVSREKIAIIVGSDNPFKNNLTFEQFAKMFRGEITDWSLLGGAPGAIRFIDHPDSSDTRRSLSTYEIFKKAPFKTGASATRLSQDDTASIVRELGKDGISYAIADQVLNLPNVHVIPMHKTLPDDPRYPYSQPRGYVYRKETATPGILGFLGFATSAPGQEIVAVAKQQEVTAARQSIPTPAANSTTAALVGAAGSDAAVGNDQGFPWWLLLLLGIPLIGGLLWWLLKGDRGSTTRPVSPGTRASAIEPGTGIGMAPIPTAGTGITETGATPIVAPAETTPITVADQDSVVSTPNVAPYAAIPGIALGAAGIAAAWARRSLGSRITLTPQNLTEAHAQWSAPFSDRSAAKQHGGQQFQLRIYDATDIDLDTQPAHSMHSYDCNELSTQRFVPIWQTERDYVAEIGYTTADSQWLKLARSTRVRVTSVEPHEVTQDVPVSDTNIYPIVGAAGITGAIATGVWAGGTWAWRLFGSRITLTPENATEAHAQWSAPETDRSAAKQHGGQQFQLRIYDATDVNLDTQPAHSMHSYDCDELSTERFVPIWQSDRDYVAEIGYVTPDSQWLKLARSNPVRVTSRLEPVQQTDWEALDAPTPAIADVEPHEVTPDVPVSDTNIPAIVGAAGIAGAIAAGAWARRSFGSRIILTPENSTEAHAQWSAPETDRSAAKQHGGQQFQLRIYDATDIDLDTQPAHSLHYYDCDELSTERFVPIWQSDRDYVAEIGYVTADSQWLKLARSNPIRVTSRLEPVQQTGWETLDAPTPAIADVEPHEVTPDVPVSDTNIPAIVGAAGIAGAIAAGAWARRSFGSRIILTPENSTEAYAQWSAPFSEREAAKQHGGQQFQLRIYDTTDIDIDTQPAHSLHYYDCDELSTERFVPIWQSDRDYVAEIGYVTADSQWLKLARSNPIRVTSRLEPVQQTDWEALDAPTPAIADVEPHEVTPDVPVSDTNITPIVGAAGIAGAIAAGAWARRSFGSRIILTPENSTEAYAQWSAPETDRSAAKQHGGQQFQLRIYDTTDIDIDTQPAHSRHYYDCDELSTERFVPIWQSDRDYVAEIGYVTPDSQWLKLARSNPIRVTSRLEPVQQTGWEALDAPTPAITDVEPPEVTPDVPVSDTNIPAASITAGSWAERSLGSHITLVARNSTEADAQWFAPYTDRSAAKEHGGRQFQLRIYDATDIDLDTQPAHSMQSYDCDELSQERPILLLQRNRDYVAEIGYVTPEDQWLKLARSNPIRVTSVWEQETPTPLIADVEPNDLTENVPVSDSTIPGVAGVIGTGAAIVGLNAGSHITLVPRNSTEADAQWSASYADREGAKQQGGRQFQLRIYDATDIDFDTQPAHSTQYYDCDELSTQRQVLIMRSDSEALPPTADRDYVAEIGYVTAEGQWLMLARSNHVRVTSTLESVQQMGWETLDLSTPLIADVEPHEVTPDVPVDDINIPSIALGGIAGVTTGTWVGRNLSSRVTLVPRNSTEVDAHWSASDTDRSAAKQLGGRQFQLRIYDATYIDLDTQQAHSTQCYDCDELSTQRQVLIMWSDRDYVAEIGYVTQEDRWLILARSHHVRVPSTGDVVEATSEAEVKGCQIQHLTVHSRHNCFHFDRQRISLLQETAVSKTLEPGIYVVRIKSGAFGYGLNVNQVGQPIVLLWVYGGIFVNKKTNVTVSATWSSLNGYDDTLTLEVLETTTLCAFFFDSYVDDNDGEVMVSVIRLYSNPEPAIDHSVLVQAIEENQDKITPKIKTVPSNYSYINKNFDTFYRDPQTDIVCVSPIRTTVRREEEITLIRRVTKVEEVDPNLSCPINTTQISPEQSEQIDISSVDSEPAT